MRLFINLIVLLCMFLISSCQIYHKKTSSLDQVINSAEKVRVVFVNGKKMQFDYIVLEEGVIYGVQREKGEIKKVILPKEKIKEIHQKNREASTGVTVALVGGLFLGFLIIYVTVTFVTNPI